MLLWTIIIIIVSLWIIMVSLLTSGDSKAFSGALVGSSDLDLFTQSKARGTKKWLARLLFVLGILLMISAIFLKVYSR